MRVSVFGAGSIGGILAVRLAALGDVALLARGPHLEAIRQNGLTLIEADGRRRSARVTASDDASDLPKADLCFVTVKAHSVPNLACAIDRSLDPGGLVVFVQNGVPWWYLRMVSGKSVSRLDPVGALSRLFPVCGTGVVSIGGRREGPGIVRQTGTGSLVVGRCDGKNDPRLEAIAAGLTDAGLQTTASTDIAGAIWTKLVANVALNSLAVLTRAPILSILDEDALRPTLLDVVAELEGLASALGHPVAFDIERQRSVVRSGQKSSTLMDIEAGRPIEFEALFGAILELADLVSHDVPHVRSLAAMVSTAATAAALKPTDA